MVVVVVLLPHFAQMTLLQNIMQVLLEEGVVVALQQPHIHILVEQINMFQVILGQ
jgi:hypothetical protein